jgi:hypothetical protein
VRLWLPLREVVINGDGSGATRYARPFGCGEVEAWAVTAFAGPEAELVEFGSAPIEGDKRVIEEMVRRLGLTWTEGDLDRFRQRAAGAGGALERRITPYLAIFDLF